MGQKMGRKVGHQFSLFFQMGRTLSKKGYRAPKRKPTQNNNNCIILGSYFMRSELHIERFTFNTNPSQNPFSILTMNLKCFKLISIRFYNKSWKQCGSHFKTCTCFPFDTLCSNSWMSLLICSGQIIVDGCCKM